MRVYKAQEHCTVSPSAKVTALHHPRSRSLYCTIHGQGQCTASSKATVISLHHPKQLKLQYCTSHFQGHCTVSPNAKVIVLHHPVTNTGGCTLSPSAKVNVLYHSMPKRQCTVSLNAKVPFNILFFYSGVGAEGRWSFSTMLQQNYF